MSYDALDIVDSFTVINEVCKNTKYCDKCLIHIITGIPIEICHLINKPDRKEMMKNYVEYHIHKQSQTSSTD